MSGVSSRLWSDEPTRLDLLSFDAVAKTVVQAVLDDALDPVTVGVSGAWGSGKTTVLRLIEDALAPQPPETDTTVLVINAAFRSVLEHWKSHAPADPDRIKRTLEMALDTGSRP